jgi:hypothetical protein
MAKYLNMEEYKALFEEWKASGMTVRDYCANIGIRENKFHNWKRKLEESKDKSPAFIPVHMSQQNGKVSFASVLKKYMDSCPITARSLAPYLKINGDSFE